MIGIFDEAAHAAQDLAAATIRYHAALDALELDVGANAMINDIVRRRNRRAVADRAALRRNENR